MYRFLDFCDGLEVHVFLVFLINSRASVPGLLSSYDSWINLSSEETLQWFVFSIIHNIRLAPHCAGPLVVTAPPQDRRKIVIRVGGDGSLNVSSAEHPL